MIVIDWDEWANAGIRVAETLVHRAVSVFNKNGNDDDDDNNNKVSMTDEVSVGVPAAPERPLTA